MKHLFPYRHLLLLMVLTLGGCTSMITSRLGNNLSNAILNQDDPETVKAGAPAYLLLLDSLIEGNPRDATILIAGARLYSVYDAVFVEDAERGQRLSSKARGYARRAICLKQDALCAVDQGPFTEMLPVLGESRYEHLPALYTYALAWALWIQRHSDNWAAVADLPKIEAMLNRVVELKDDFEEGQAHLYLGILHSQRPPSLGGKPELARRHFEKALRHSQGRDLMIKVEYARHYGRMMFDQALHDRLLNEVLNAEVVVPGHTLSNVLAQRQARELLRSSADYF
ncbi:MAG: TRAP transporter TatT component family protein [Gammaproteobacteria bacterium]|nr:TRAP transporter TatT component family protein [Gammaproteobacteria bacterium]